MKTGVEFAGYLTLALGLHLAAWQYGASGPPNAAAPAGEGAVALSGATVALQDLVAQWQTPPAPVQSLPNLPLPNLPLSHLRPAKVAPPPTLPQPLVQAPAQTAPAPLQPMADTAMTLRVDSAPPPPPKPPQPPPPKPPQPPPDPPPPKAKPQPEPKAQTARQTAPKQAARSGTPKPTAKAPGGAGRTAASDPGQMAKWGGAIRRSIEQRKRYPAGSRAKGAVSLAITVSSDGGLAGLSILRSSGDAGLDRAALDAVKRARLPKAPAKIQAGSHRFKLSISFDG